MRSTCERCKTEYAGSPPGACPVCERDEKIERLQAVVDMVWGRVIDDNGAEYTKRFIADSAGRLGVFLSPHELCQLRDAAKEQADDAG